MVDLSEVKWNGCHSYKWRTSPRSDGNGINHLQMEDLSEVGWNWDPTNGGPLRGQMELVTFSNPKKS